MNAFELLQQWPSWAGATAETIYHSPAWLMPVRWGDQQAYLRRSDVTYRDVLGISIRLDDEEHFLGLGDSKFFPDLQTLWEVKNELPETLKLALVEKECGVLLQLLENATRRQLSIADVAPSNARAGSTGFAVVDAAGNILCEFDLDVTPALVSAFGQLKYLDVQHEAIRTLTRDAWAVYASFALTPQELAGLSTGDYLLLPEASSGTATWQTSLPQNDFLTIVSNQPVQLSFAQFADEQLPPVPSAETLQIYRQGRVIARGRLDNLAGQGALAIEELF